MKHQVDESLKGLLVDISQLVHLEGNPRKGNVDAIMASYSEFGQMRPIVIRPNNDGTSTILAGNHQVMAAKKLGWTHIAAVSMDADNARAVAFALADNRTVELGYTDNAMASELISTISESYTELLDGLGWDEFEIAYYEEQADRANLPATNNGKQGFVAPIIAATDAAIEQITSMVRRDDDGEKKIIADTSVDHSDAAIRGSTVATPGAAPKAVVQYTIVFENAEQQRRWYDFVRWLRSSPAYDGVTTAEKLVSFIDAHSEV